ncbi:hypothetical protein MKEN_00559400 [Mycena kentingensis (nom. inval.)]|nr:hypothetical protein MKEN_00559400 [Mycena kentingensis (nom. inval.)]
MAAPAPRLPLELEWRIFDLAAWGDLVTARTLSLVAYRVHVWMQSILYHVLDILDTRSLDRCLAQLGNYPALLKHTRCLALEFEIRRDNPAQVNITTSLLAACPNLTNLAQWTGVNPATLAELRPLRSLRHLSIDLFALFGGPQNFRVPPPAHLGALQRITHLDVYGRFPTPTPRSDGAVFHPHDVFNPAVFPALTHLAFPYSPLYDEQDFHETFDGILRAFELPLTAMRVLVFYAELEEDPAKTLLKLETGIEDPRFCVVVSDVSYPEDWKSGVWGGEDVWSRAEQRVAGRTWLAEKRIRA